MTFDDERGSKPTEIVPPADTKAKTIIEDVFDAGEGPETIADDPSATFDPPRNQDLKTIVEPPPVENVPQPNQDIRTVIARPTAVPQAANQDQKTVVDPSPPDVLPGAERDKDGSRISPKMAAGAAAGLGLGAVGGAYVASEAVDQVRDRLNEDAASGAATESLDVFDNEVDSVPAPTGDLATDLADAGISDQTETDPSAAESGIDPADPSGAATTPRPAPDRPEDASVGQVAMGSSSGSSGEPLFPDTDEAPGFSSVAPDTASPRPPIVPDDGTASADDASTAAVPAGSTDTPTAAEPVDQVVSEAPSTAPTAPAPPPAAADSVSPPIEAPAEPAPPVPAADEDDDEVSAELDDSDSEDEQESGTDSSSSFADSSSSSQPFAPEDQTTSADSVDPDDPLATPPDPPAATGGGLPGLPGTGLEVFPGLWITDGLQGPAVDEADNPYFYTDYEVFGQQHTIRIYQDEDYFYPAWYDESGNKIAEGRIEINNPDYSSIAWSEDAPPPGYTEDPAQPGYVEPAPDYVEPDAPYYGDGYTIEYQGYDYQVPDPDSLEYNAEGGYHYYNGDGYYVEVHDAGGQAEMYWYSEPGGEQYGHATIDDQNYSNPDYVQWHQYVEPEPGYDQQAADQPGYGQQNAEDSDQTGEQPDETQDEPLSFTEPATETPDSNEPLDFTTTAAADPMASAQETEDPGEEPDMDSMTEPEPVISEPVIIHEPPAVDPGLGPDPDEGADSLDDDAADDDLEMP